MNDVAYETTGFLLYLLFLVPIFGIIFFGFYLWGKYKKGYSTDLVGPIVWFDGVHNLSKKKNPTKEQKGWLKYNALLYLLGGGINVSYYINRAN